MTCYCFRSHLPGRLHGVPGNVLQVPHSATVLDERTGNVCQGTGNACQHQGLTDGDVYQELACLGQEGSRVDQFERPAEREYVHVGGGIARQLYELGAW